MNKKYTIIYPPTISWHDHIFQRPHQLLAEFARQGHFSILVNTRHDKRGTFWMADTNLCISNHLDFTLKDSEIKNRMDGSKVVFWVTYPKTLEYIDLVNPDILVFDYIDECVEEFSHWKMGIEEAMVKANLVVVTSDRLYELTKVKFGHKMILIRNGADIHQFLNEDKIILHADLRLIREKHEVILGFHGSLQTWVDFRLIADIAKLRPNWGIVLIGPEYVGIGECKKLANVYSLGQKPYTQLRHYVRNFDVGIIPFEVRDMTQSSNPIKMYEYLASEIPVIATPLRECLNLSPYVRTASTASEFAEQIEDALKNKDSEKNHYKRLAYENSWTKRVEDIIEALEEVNEVNNWNASQE